MRFVISLAALAALAACQQPAPPAPTPEPTPQTAPAPPPPPTGWTVIDGEPLTLTFTGTGRGLSVSCAEGKKELRISFTPGWDATKDGMAPNTTKATVMIGTLAFDASADADSHTANPLQPTYVLKATADNVSALMASTNLGVRLKSGAQERSGDPADNGAFDTFATTCAQINGLK